MTEDFLFDGKYLKSWNENGSVLAITGIPCPNYIKFWTWRKLYRTMITAEDIVTVIALG